MEMSWKLHILTVELSLPLPWDLKKSICWFFHAKNIWVTSTVSFKLGQTGQVLLMKPYKRDLNNLKLIKRIIKKLLSKGTDLQMPTLCMLTLNDHYNDNKFTNHTVSSTLSWIQKKNNLEYLTCVPNISNIVDFYLCTFVNFTLQEFKAETLWLNIWKFFFNLTG